MSPRAQLVISRLFSVNVQNIQPESNAPLSVKCGKVQYQKVCCVYWFDDDEGDDDEGDDDEDDDYEADDYEADDDEGDDDEDDDYEADDDVGDDDEDDDYEADDDVGGGLLDAVFWHPAW